MTRRELTGQLASLLGERHEARLIVEEVLGRVSGGGDPSAAQVARAMALAERCVAGEPLQYVLGHWAFRTLDLLVDARVLIPRPETEQVVEVALAELQRLASAAPVVVDAGTGSGAIALSVAAEAAAGEVYAVDASMEALAVARTNLERVGADGGRALLPVTLLEGSWLEPLPTSLRGAVTLVVANPPYVAEAEWPELPPQVQAEPRQALVAGPASDGTPGLADVETVLEQALGWLARPGAVVVELAPHQAPAARRRAEALGYRDTEVRVDLAQRPRALVGRVG